VVVVVEEVEVGVEDFDLSGGSKYKANEPLSASVMISIAAL
jgi:hypothetical protein